MDIFCKYEQHFGLSGDPFATTPDPGFHFDSCGHRRAFAYLRYGVLEGECFIVMTGEIGAGKTTLVHKLLRGLESEAIVLAQIASTGLDARALLAAVMAAFRAPVAGDSSDELRAGLQAFLATLTSTGRKGLLVFDEAQHLLPDAIEELMGLAKLQSRSGSPLQVLLAGQPNLRTTLQSTSARAMCELPVFVLCDIGLLSLSETRAYIEHRLHQVQWNKSPSFSDGAYERIYRATDGVPRRINRLCNRLLMAACQQELNSISEALVEQTNTELREEMGDVVAAPVAVATEMLPHLLPDARESVTPPRSAIPTIVMAVGGNARSTDLSNKPAFSAHDENFEFVRRFRRASSGPRWPIISLAGLVFALVIGWWAYSHERLSPLAVSPGAVAGKVTSNGETAPESARVGELTENAPGAIGRPPSGQEAPMPATASAEPSAALQAAHHGSGAGAAPLVAKAKSLRAPPRTAGAAPLVAKRKSLRAAPRTSGAARLVAKPKSLRAPPRTAGTGNKPARLGSRSAPDRRAAKPLRRLDLEPPQLQR